MKSVGDRYEDFAVQYLTEREVKILDRNFRTRSGEIDIIGEKKGRVYFFEVRYRSRNSIQSATESISGLKLSRLWSTISVWLNQSKYDESSVGGVYAFLIDGVGGSQQSKNIVKIVEIGV
ncbi:MAG: YraN family protein [Candidatus Dojkabacteria bacterium]|nr:MAG: YraN family protein [Candidatus Dojkabacteria bacterium]